MHKLKKIIISLVLSLTLMSVFSFCVFAKSSVTDNGTHCTYRYEGEHTLGYLSCFNSNQVCYSNYLCSSDSSSYQCFGYEFVSSEVLNPHWTITSVSWKDNSDHSKGAYYFTVKVFCSGYRDYLGYISTDTWRVNHYYAFTDYTFNINCVQNSSPYYAKLPLQYYQPFESLSGVSEGDTLTYYDFQGNEVSISFNGDSFGPDGFGGGSADRFPGEVTEEPSLDDYLPDFNDSKYNPGDLSSYLPAPPDSLDILDWLKYFIDCVKAFFNWAVDTFKAKILLLYDTITALFNFLKDYLTYFLDKLKQGLFDLFVPSDDFAQSAIDKFSQVELSSTFLNSTVAPVVQALEQTIDRSPKKYEFTAFGAECSFDFSSLQSIIPVTDAIIIFFSYFFGLKHLVFSFLNLFSTIKKEGD